MKTPTVKLPTLAAFRKLPLAKRTALFRRWVKAQPPRKAYVYERPYACPLAQFGRAIVGKRVWAGADAFSTDSHAAEKESATRVDVMEWHSPEADSLCCCDTFGQLARFAS